MKQLFLFILSFGLSSLMAQALPEVSLQDLRGGQVMASEIGNDGSPMIVSFWATWCKPCIQELKTIGEEYEYWQDETGVKLIAISIDDNRTAGQVKSMVYGFDWPYEVYLDRNQALKRAMNVVNVPHTFLLDGEGKIVYQHTSYIPGDEQDLYDHVLELVEKAKASGEN
jgi:cytochrome c biogenesis protein CcmG, thiol:disulfide interchange protein DsbE